MFVVELQLLSKARRTKTPIIACEDQVLTKFAVNKSTGNPKMVEKVPMKKRGHDTRGQPAQQGIYVRSSRACTLHDA